MTCENTRRELYYLNPGKIVDNQDIQIIGQSNYTVGKHQNHQVTNLNQTQNREPGHLKNIKTLDK